MPGCHKGQDYDGRNLGPTGEIADYTAQISEYQIIEVLKTKLLRYKLLSAIKCVGSTDQPPKASKLPAKEGPSKKEWALQGVDRRSTLLKSGGLSSAYLVPTP